MSLTANEVTLAMPTPGEGPLAAPAAAPAANTPGHNTMTSHIHGEDPQARPAVPSPAPATKPANLPDKFWDAKEGKVRVDELARSYAELEKTRNAPKPAVVDDKAKAAANPEAPKADAEDPNKGAEAERLLPEGLLEKLETKFAEKGELEDSDFESLQKLGLSREDVNDYIAFRTQRGERLVNELMDTAGGTEQYNRMAEWAEQNWDAAKQEAFNKAVGNYRDRFSAELAIRGLQAEYERAVGREPKLIQGSNPATSSDSFSTREEITKARRDPRFKTDPAYRAEFDRRLANSNLFG